MYCIESKNPEGLVSSSVYRLDEIVSMSVEKSNLTLVLRHNPTAIVIHSTSDADAWKTFVDIKLELLDL